MLRFTRFLTDTVHGAEIPDAVLIPNERKFHHNASNTIKHIINKRMHPYFAWWEKSVWPGGHMAMAMAVMAPGWPMARWPLAAAAARWCGWPLAAGSSDTNAGQQTNMSAIQLTSNKFCLFPCCGCEPCYCS